MLPLMSKITPMEMGTSSLEKCDDFLFDAVLIDAEIFLLQSRNQAAIGIGDRDVDQRQLHFRLNRLAAFYRGSSGGAVGLEGPATCARLGSARMQQARNKEKDPILPF